MTTKLTSPSDLIDMPAGQPLGTTDWRQVSQQEVNLFADATADHQWIHTDPVRAESGPFGGTIAHGYLTLALAPTLIAEVLSIDELSAVLNYGLDKVRFPAPVPVGGRVRAHVNLKAARARDTGVEAVLGLTYELEGAERPVCVADVVCLYR